MKKLLIDANAVKKMSACFSDQEEAKEFFENLDSFAEETAFYTQCRNRAMDEEATLILIKQTFAFVSFCRSYIDLIHQLIANFDCKEITEDEIKKLTEQE